MKRYASHLLFLPRYGYLERYAVEMKEGIVIRLFPLTEEVENTEWLPGVIALLSAEDADAPGFEQHRERLKEVPADTEERLPLLTAFLFSPFDFTTMRPGAGTRRRQLR